MEIERTKAIRECNVIRRVPVANILSSTGVGQDNKVLQTGSVGELGTERHNEQPECQGEQKSS
jgi:hypothetical protein